MPLPVSIKIHVTPLERGREKEGGGGEEGEHSEKWWGQLLGILQS